MILEGVWKGRVQDVGERVGRGVTVFIQEYNSRVADLHAMRHKASADSYPPDRADGSR